jgi:hypothetical protein
MQACRLGRPNLSVAHPEPVHLNQGSSLLAMNEPHDLVEHAAGLSVVVVVRSKLRMKSCACSKAGISRSFGAADRNVRQFLNNS